jgi:hypothetical protein
MPVQTNTFSYRQFYWQKEFTIKILISNLLFEDQINSDLCIGGSLDVFTSRNKSRFLCGYFNFTGEDFWLETS